MLNKLKQNYRLANVLSRVLFVAAYVFATWQRYLQASFLIIAEQNLLVALLASALVGVVAQFIVPLLVKMFLNMSRIHSVPVAEYCILALLYFSAAMAASGAVCLVGWFVPVASVWLGVLAPVAATLVVGFLFFRRTSALYFNDVTAVVYAKSYFVAWVILLVIVGVIL